MAKIMITGALGHIGSRFIHSIQPGDFEEVRLLDNFATQRYLSLFGLPKDVLFHFIEDDICTANLEKYFENIDVVVHLASLTDAASSYDNKEEVERINYKGAERVARACITCGCRLIFPSSTSVYGVQKDIVDEDCPAEELMPQSPYAESKIKAEQLLLQLGVENGLRFIIFRLGTIFGYSIGMRFHTAVNKFIWQAVTGQDITVWKTALHQKRPYCGLTDCINAIKFIIDNSLFDRKTYNILTTNLTVKDILDVIKKYIPSIEISFVDSPIMNQLSYNVSNSKSLKLGFTYHDDLQVAVGEVIRKLKGINHSIRININKND